MLDRRLVERVADDLGTSTGLIEKDWHVVRARGVIAQVDPAGMTSAFSGGTSRSKGWELIKRFSEDIDFKVAEPLAGSASAARRARGAYRDRLLDALSSAGFEVEGKPGGGNEGRFFWADCRVRGAVWGRRGPADVYPHRGVVSSAAVSPIASPIRSLIAAAQREPAEIAAFACVDAVETAADKLSALAWRVRVRRRGSPKDDPTIIRHLHDLAALEPSVATAANFRELVLAAVPADVGRGGESNPPTDFAEIFAGMLERLETDALWAREYEDFVKAVSFAASGEGIGSAGALAACARLVSVVK